MLIYFITRRQIMFDGKTGQDGTCSLSYCRTECSHYLCYFSLRRLSFWRLYSFYYLQASIPFFTQKTRLNRQVSALLVIIISIFLVLIPLFFLLSMVIIEIQQILLNQEAIMATIEVGDRFLTISFQGLESLKTSSRSILKKG